MKKMNDEIGECSDRGVFLGHNVVQPAKFVPFENVQRRNAVHFGTPGAGMSFSLKMIMVRDALSNDCK